MSTHDCNAEIVETLRTTASKEDVEVKLHLENGYTITGNCEDVRHYRTLKKESDEEHPSYGSASFDVKVDASEIPTEHGLNLTGHYTIIDAEENRTTGKWRDPEADWYVEDQYLDDSDEDIYGCSAVIGIEVLDSD
ncbi:hypothetical protein [Halorubellus sp. PRR65]|uniref:hypothetical protein n=1 Tax=Halorubellus sp. PRR65 TaxID=3098148 RepID=UPI002B25CA0C|nr:hypothetical protein [Halorubellus sp. PRR65]